MYGACEDEEDTRVVVTINRGVLDISGAKEGIRRADVSPVRTRYESLVSPVAPRDAPPAEHEQVALPEPSNPASLLPRSSPPHPTPRHPAAPPVTGSALLQTLGAAGGLDTLPIAPRTTPQRRASGESSPGSDRFRAGSTPVWSTGFTAPTTLNPTALQVLSSARDDSLAQPPDPCEAAARQSAPGACLPADPPAAPPFAFSERDERGLSFSPRTGGGGSPARLSPRAGDVPGGADPFPLRSAPEPASAGGERGGVGARRDLSEAIPAGVPGPTLGNPRCGGNGRDSASSMVELRNGAFGNVSPRWVPPRSQHAGFEGGRPVRSPSQAAASGRGTPPGKPVAGPPTQDGSLAALLDDLERDATLSAARKQGFHYPESVAMAARWPVVAASGRDSPPATWAPLPSADWVVHTPAGALPKLVSGAPQPPPAAADREATETPDRAGSEESGGVPDAVPSPPDAAGQGGVGSGEPGPGRPQRACSTPPPFSAIADEDELDGRGSSPPADAAARVARVEGYLRVHSPTRAAKARDMLRAVCWDDEGLVRALALMHGGQNPALLAVRASHRLSSASGRSAAVDSVIGAVLGSRSREPSSQLPGHGQKRLGPQDRLGGGGNPLNGTFGPVQTLPCVDRANSPGRSTFASVSSMSEDEGDRRSLAIAAVLALVVGVVFM
eukprot:gene18697-28862_t